MNRQHHQRGHICKHPCKSGLQIVYRQLQADGTWKQKWETLTGVWSRKEARKILDDRLRVVNTNTPAPVAKTFAQFVADEWASHVANKCKRSTVAGYQSMTDTVLLPALGGMPLASITIAHLDAVLAAQRKAGKAPKTVSNLRVLLATMFGVARKKKLVPVNPVEDVDTITVPRKRKPVLTRQQVRAIVGALQPEHRVLVVLLALTALRIGEALGLRWCDVDFGGATLAIAHNWVRDRLEETPKTDASESTKPLSPVLLTALQQHQAASMYTAPTDFVFCASNGNPLDPNNWRKRIWYPVLAKVGVQRTEPRAFGFHMLRHTAITHFLQQTRDVKATQMFARHANIGTTMNVYAKYLPDTARDDAAKFEQNLLIGGTGAKRLVAVSGDGSEALQ